MIDAVANEDVTIVFIFVQLNDIGHTLRRRGKEFNY